MIATGDLMDPDICKGPFDVVIERRTVQLFRDQKEQALECLLQRLATPGTLVSHEHNGGWRLGQPRQHYAEEWLRTQGIAIRETREAQELADAPRAAYLVYSSG